MTLRRLGVFRADNDSLHQSSAPFDGDNCLVIATPFPGHEEVRAERTTKWNQGGEGNNLDAVDIRKGHVSDGDAQHPNIHPRILHWVRENMFKAVENPNDHDCTGNDYGSNPDCVCAIVNCSHSSSRQAVSRRCLY